ncbi:hypothetical protein [Trichormus azollae]|uniref:hypothetical protein n=1 Tax=Trichormus azollae TaxID=1164 RepID=UPI001651A8F2|nr:hypothetical protein [Trichormus azollae]
MQKILAFDVSWLCTAKKFHWLVTSGMLTEVWNIESCRRYWLMEDYVVFKSIMLNTE